MKKYVLLVDDDVDDHEMFTYHVARHKPHIEVVSAYDGLQALEMIQMIQPHWIFLDINMPGMNGIEILKKIKESKQFSDIPVYMYSTSDGFNHKPIVLKLGAEKYFQKPNSEKDFIVIFEEAFSA